ncbi:MAG: ribonuclease HI [Clostridia bacterium]|nr:ribonuclease HI [Clostridia bacterium]
MKKVIIYTDGACSGNPGPGGYGLIISCDGKTLELSGREDNTTNNRMELMAAIIALETLKFPCEVELYSDSSYLVNAYNNNWIEGWKKNGWKNSSKQPVKNIELWERLDTQMGRHKVNLIKVKGHADVELNNRCDKLATDAVKGIIVAK